MGFHDPASPVGTLAITVLNWYACTTPAAGLIGYCVRDGPPPTSTLTSWNRVIAANDKVGADGVHCASGVAVGSGVPAGVPLGVAPNDTLGVGSGTLAHGQNRVKLAPPEAPHVDDGPTGFQHTFCCPPPVSVDVVYPGSAAPPVTVVSKLVSVPQSTPAAAAMASSSGSVGCESNAAATHPPCAAQTVSHDAPGAPATQSSAAMMSHVEGVGVRVGVGDVVGVCDEPKEGEGDDVAAGVTVDVGDTVMAGVPDTDAVTVGVPDTDAVTVGVPDSDADFEAAEVNVARDRVAEKVEVDDAVLEAVEVDDAVLEAVEEADGVPV